MMAPVLRERKMAKEGERGDNVKKDKALLTNFKKNPIIVQGKPRLKRMCKRKRQR